MITVEILARSGEAAKSGPIGFAVILVLCVVCYFLFKSMSKHLKTVRERFPTNAQPPAQNAPEAPASTERVRLDKPAPQPDDGSAPPTAGG